MKKFIFFLIPFISFSQITLENIWSYKYYARGVEAFQSMNEGKTYTLLTENGVEKFSYANRKSLQVLAEGKFESYSFNNDETYLLLQTESQPIYRHSQLGKYQIQKVGTQQKSWLNNGNFAQEPVFSPNSKRIAFVSENNIFIQNIETNTITQVTFDGKKNAIINGINDWVYEEEFGHVSAMTWSADSNYLIFVKFDESNVKQINISTYEKSLYPEIMQFKYPKAGEENSKVTLHNYNVTQQKTTEINLSNVENYYIPLLKSSLKSDKLFVLTSNRHQNKVDVLSLNPINNQITKLFTETDKAWIDTDNFTLDFLVDNSFLWTSERDGFRHIYYYNADGKLVKQITKGNFDVTEVYGTDKAGNVYYQAAKSSAKNREIFSTNLKTNKLKTISSSREGTYSAQFSKDFSFAIMDFSDINSPKKTSLVNLANQKSETLQDNGNVQKALQNDNFAKFDFLEITNAQGQKLSAWMLKPNDFSEHKKYPVLMYVYGGPGSQEVNNAYDGINNAWFQLLAQQGFLVFCVDGRGTGCKGADFKKITYKNLGKNEIEDQIFAAQWLQKQSFVDAQRIGIFGWSFGGYMTLLALTKGASIFKTGISVAPVTNWRFYDTVYTERFLQTPQENPQGYDDNSPIFFAKNLKGKLLMIHGTADDNVHFQNSVEMSEALIQADKPFEQAYYPDKNHGIYGGKTRLHLYRKMTNFLLENL